MRATLGRPAVRLFAAGVPLPHAFAQCLGEVRVVQRLSLPSQCELAFADPPASLGVADHLAPGIALRVAVAGFAAPVFVGEVTAIEYVYGPSHATEVRVRAYDPLHRLRRRQGVHAHVDVTARSLATELVADLDLTVEATGVGPRWRHLIQAGRSDLDLLRDVTEPYGAYATVRDRTLHLITLAGIGDVADLALGASLLEARFDVNEARTSRSVTSLGWNVRSTEVFRTEAEVVPTSHVGASGPAGRGDAHGPVLVDRIVQERAQAQAAAQAELDHRSAGRVTFWGVAEGDPTLRPGARVRVAGVDPSLAGPFVLCTVTHVLDARSGFVSELSSTPPPRSEAPDPTAAVLGQVTRVDDPDGLGRVRVALPVHADVETDWLQVVSLGAGAGKGLMVLPDRGDRVLVLAPHGDLSQGVVLGGLYGGEGWPDAGVDGAAVRRFTLRTSGGHSLVFDDGRRSIRVGDTTGSYVELTPERVRVHAATDLELEAPGRSVTIRGQAIEFERG